MPRKVLILLACSLLVLPSAGRAAELSGRSRSYLISRDADEFGRHLTFYEYLDSEVFDLGEQGLSLHAGGWGRADFEDETGGKDARGELQYAYLSYLAPTANAAVSLGRLYVNEGVAAAEQMDGASAGLDLPGGFSARAYAGVPTETDIEGRGGDLVWGGRISHARGSLYRVGVSYLREDDDGEDFREERGLDLFLRPWPRLELLGQSSYNAIADEWMEHDWKLTLGVADNLRLTVLAYMADYGAYFQSPVNSAFTFPFIDPEEEITILGGLADYTFANGWVVTADYRDYGYEQAGDARSLGAFLTFPFEGGGGGLSLRRVDGDAEKYRYYEFRAYAFARFGRWDGVLDVLDVSYDESINGVSDAYSVSGSLGCSFGESLKVALEGEYGHNPFFDEELKGTLKAVWKFAASVPGKGGQ